MVNIGSLSYGAHADGLEELYNKIHMECIEEAKSKLDDTSKVFEALDNCWLGEDRDKFKENFTSFKNNVKKALDEYDQAIKDEFQAVFTQWNEFQKNNVK